MKPSYLASSLWKGELGWACLVNYHYNLAHEKKTVVPQRKRARVGGYHLPSLVTSTEKQCASCANRFVWFLPLWARVISIGIII